mmetsp:Transcript_7095/g.21187  ORF Transcript_7095/g.21187 Transcript_7095/m.21187 type:complete len:239 (-) Transcript_7095:197-913(-)|eukprot:CAMPEP_0113579130 /NCGR_PEP_ID=MMETSP0015_2-20120614/29898_1 /TAXON_ID=2838 /ORGANISM="Odontella" /LENGTH=238 /DNA_ID=CAMNT_0000483077 /DNA_START=26 /DNA_END=742 /DNA_ORIENTATION=- /assembly_acc=CAM_ASM_000160
MATASAATATDPSKQPTLPSDGAGEDHHPSFSGEAPPEVIHEPLDHHHPPTDIKAILKKDPHMSGTDPPVDGGDAHNDDADHHHKKKKYLKWDEHAIEEHDLLRGTRMKIDEPNTPYAHYDHHDEHSDDGSAKHPRTPPEQQLQEGQCLTQNWDKLEAKLTSVAAARDAYPSSPSASSRDGGSVHSDEEEARRRRHHELEFKMHRKHHYNEMELVRRFREQHPDDEDDDDADDDKMEM